MYRLKPCHHDKTIVNPFLDFLPENLLNDSYPLDAGRNINVHKAFRRKILLHTGGKLNAYKMFKRTKIKQSSLPISEFKERKTT